MKNLLIISLLLLLNFCNDGVSDSEKEFPGSVYIIFNKINIPENIASVRMFLTRSGFEDIEQELNLRGENSDEVQISNLDPGTWLLKIEAHDINNESLNSGETEVFIKSDEITYVSTNLIPLLGNDGDIYIYVSRDDLPYYWFDQPTNPVVSKTGNQFDNYGVGQSHVIFEDSLYKMWYTSLSNNGVTYVFYATSVDGINWNKYGSNPIISPGENGAWDSRHVSVGTIIKENSQYKLYYVGWKDQYSQWSIGLATSNNGIVWTKRTSPVLSGGNWDYQLSATSILKIDSLYYMYYGGKSSTTGLTSIGIAVSLDGIQWTKHNNNPILTGTLSWENGAVSYPAIVYDKNLFKMVYQCGGVNSFGIAYSEDGINWVKKSDAPFFTTNLTSHKLRIAYPMIQKSNYEYRIYYTAFLASNEWLTCVARKYIIN